MGERKGQNKYYPPDYDPKKGGLNAFLGTHALRERAKKIHLGILVIRFEMPYNVWCEGCGNHIARGVRYNAEKSKIGMYYTTPIYKFRMKCHLCNTHFEIKTDPQNFDYEIISGLRRQERRWEASEQEQIAATDRETSKKLATDAMYKLEHGETDQAKAKASTSDIARLQNLKERMFDDYAQNQLLRKLQRTRKAEEKAVHIADAAVQKKYALDIPLLPESADDRKLGTLMAQYRTVQSCEETQQQKRHEVLKRPLFGCSQSQKGLLYLDSRSNTIQKVKDKPSTSTQRNLVKERLRSQQLELRKSKAQREMSVLSSKLSGTIQKKPVDNNVC